MGWGGGREEPPGTSGRREDVGEEVREGSGTFEAGDGVYRGREELGRGKE